MSSAIAFCETLKRVITCIDYGDRQLLNQFSLTVPRYYALKHIYENPGISLTNLSSLMFIDKSSTTRLIRSIKEEGLVQQLRSESDRRTYRLYLSESGMKLLERASAAHDKYTQDRFSNLLIDLGTFADDLEVLMISLERELKREGQGGEKRNSTKRLFEA
jgi:DNA-binding MarR family transcriptional regulator